MYSCLKLGIFVCYGINADVFNGVINKLWLQEGRIIIKHIILEIRPAQLVTKSHPSMTPLSLMILCPYP